MKSRPYGSPNDLITNRHLQNVHFERASPRAKLRTCPTSHSSINRRLIHGAALSGRTGKYDCLTDAPAVVWKRCVESVRMRITIDHSARPACPVDDTLSPEFPAAYWLPWKNDISLTANAVQESICLGPVWLRLPGHRPRMRDWPIGAISVSVENSLRFIAEAPFARLYRSRHTLRGPSIQYCVTPTSIRCWMKRCRSRVATVVSRSGFSLSCRKTGRFDRRYCGHLGFVVSMSASSQFGLS